MEYKDYGINRLREIGEKTISMSCQILFLGTYDYGVVFYVPFNIIYVMSKRWKGD